METRLRARFGMGHHAHLAVAAFVAAALGLASVGGASGSPGSTATRSRLKGRIVVMR
jgi:hypothetical protein